MRGGGAISAPSTTDGEVAAESASAAPTPDTADAADGSAGAETENPYTTECFSEADKAKAVTSIALPATVKAIDVAFFQLFPNAAAVQVAAGNDAYQSYNGMLLNAAATDLLLVPEGMEGAAVLPSTLATVPACAFSRCTKLSAIDLSGSTEGSSFTSRNGILYKAEGDALTLLAAPAGIGASATIDAACARIAEGAFRGNKNLKTIVAAGNVADIAEGAFAAEAIEAATVLATERAAWEAAGFTRFATPAEPGEVLAPAPGDSGLTYTLMENGQLSVAWTGDAPASGKRNIPSAATLHGVDYTVSVIEDGAFAGQAELTEIGIPDTITAIGEGAFESCTVLQSVSIPGGVETVSASAFAGCESLAAATLPEGIRTIGDAAFQGTALKQLVLPASVKAVGDYAFANSPNLKTIVALGTPEQVSATALADCAGVAVYYPYREGADHPWNLGPVTNGNHAYAYGLKPAQETYELEVGETVNIFDNGGYLVAEGDVEVTSSYKAYAISADEGGTVCAKAAGAVALSYELELDEVALDSSISAAAVKESAPLDADDEAADEEAGATEQEAMPLASSQGEYSITYQLNGGTLPEGAELVHYYNESDGEWESEPLSSLKKTGYHAIGWNTQSPDDAYPYTGASSCLDPEKNFAVELSPVLTADYRWTKSAGATGDATIAVIWAKYINLDTGDVPRGVVISNWQDVISHASSFGLTIESGIDNSPLSFTSICKAGFLTKTAGQSLKDFTPPTASNGYSFNGYWSTASGDGVQYIDRNGKLTADGAKLATQINDIPDTLYARWDPYKITLDSQGADETTPGTKEYYVKYGINRYTDMSCSTSTIISTIEIPKKAGYVFRGYYTEPDGEGTRCIRDDGKIEASKTQFTEDTTLYAFWNKRPLYEITLKTVNQRPEYDKTIYYWPDKGYVTSETSTEVIAAGEKIIDPPTRDGMNFRGYYANELNQTPFYIDKDGNLLPNAPIIDQNNVMWYGSWETAKVMLNYYDKSGDRLLNTDTFIPGVTVTLASDPQVTAPGYTAQGWATSKNQTKADYWFDGSQTFNDKTTKNLYLAESANTYKITFDDNGGSGGPGSLEIKYDETLSGSFPGWTNIPTQGGYEFVGYWTGVSSGNQYFGVYENDPCMDGPHLHQTQSWDIARDTVLYARWNPIRYSITYKGVNASVDSNPKSYTAKDPDIRLASPAPRDGYTFTGWTITGALGAGIANNSTAAATIKQGTYGALTCEAGWTRAEYKVTFYDNGGSGGPGTVDWTYMSGLPSVDHNTATKPIPTRTGYIFDGYYEKNGDLNGGDWGTLYFSDCVCLNDDGGIDAPGLLCCRHYWDKASNGTIYAKWRPIAYLTRFEPNGGTGSMEDKSFEYDEPQSLPVCEYSRVGYTFLGWSESKEKANDETLPDEKRYNYGNGARVSNLTSEAGKTVQLWAAWKKNAYQVVFWANHPDDPNGSATQDMTYDVSANLRGNTFQRDRWAFDHWTTERDGGGEKYENEALVKNLTTGADASTQTFHLYAQWTQTNFDVIYHANGGTYVEPAQVDKGAAVPNKETTREGYAFTGWFKDEACKEKWDFDADRMPNGSLDLYAGWDANEFTVTLDSGRGAGDPVSRTFVYNLKEDKKEEQHLPKFADLGFVPPTGYGFSAWALSENPGADDLKWEDAAEVSTGLSAGDAVTLYAQYAPITYYVFFNPNPPEDSSVSGDMPDNGMQLLTYDALEALNENMFQCDGYDFDGWNTVSSPTTENPGLAIADEAGTDKALNLLDRFGVTTLYAQWKGTPYTVKFDANGGKGEMSDAAFYRGLAQELPANQFKRDGHLFAGWSTAADGSGEVFPDQAMVKNLAEKGQSEVTLYAQWNVMYNVSVPTVDHIKVLMTDDGGWITAEGAQSTITSTTPAEIGISGVRCEGAAGLADLLAAESQDKASELQLKLTANGKSALVRPGETVTDASFYFRLDEGSASVPATLPMEFELAALSPDIKLIEQTEPKDAFHLTFMLGIIQQ